MADLGDFIDIAVDIAELFFDSKSESRKKTYSTPFDASKPYSRGKDHVSHSSSQSEDEDFRGSLPPAHGTNSDSGVDDPERIGERRPETTENSTAREYCETCIDEKDTPRPAVRLSHRNIREAFILSELIAPPLSRRGPRTFY